MTCPYCLLPIDWNDKNLVTGKYKNGKNRVVDVYECMRDNRIFVVKAGSYIYDNGTGSKYDLRTGFVIDNL